jgi:hypothetical protein
MMSKMIPIVWRIATLAMKPDDEQDQTEDEHAAASSCPPFASCAEDLADRTLIVPTPTCQSACCVEANGVGEPQRIGGSFYGEPSKNGLKHAIEKRLLPCSRRR